MKEEIRKEVMKVFDQQDSVDNVVDNILRLFGVSVQCEHPYNSVMKGNDIRPTQCLKCGKALSEH